MGPRSVSLVCRSVSLVCRSVSMVCRSVSLVCRSVSLVCCKRRLGSGDHLDENVKTEVPCHVECLRFFVPLKNFHLCGDITITGEGLQILTYTWHSWPIEQWGFLSLLYMYINTEHPCIMVIFEDP